MTKISQEILDEIKNSDFSQEEQKKLHNIFSHLESPTFPHYQSFKNQLREKLEHKITDKQEIERSNFIKNLPSFVKWRFRLTGFVSAFVVFLFLFITSFFTNFFREKIIIDEKFVVIDDQSFSGLQKIQSDFSFFSPTKLLSQKTAPTIITIFDGGEESAETDHDNFYQGVLSQGESIEDNSFEESIPDSGSGSYFYNETIETKVYSFLYDGSHYPKLKDKLPVYKNNGVLISQSTQQLNLNHLKIGNFSLQNLEINKINDISVSNENYELHINFQDGNIDLFHETQEIPKKFGETQNERTLKNRIKSRFSQAKIPLDSYGDLVIDNVNGSKVSFYFPFLIEGKEVFLPSASEIIPLKMSGMYDSATDEMDLYNLSLAQYQKSQYPLISQEEVIEKIITGGDFYHEGIKTPYSIGIKVSDPKLVYLQNGEYFVPALQFLVDTSNTSLDTKTSVLYIQLVK